MTKTLQNMMGGNNDAARLAEQQAAAAQRRALAEMAMAAAKEDTAKTGKKRGRSLLTYLGAEGQATLG